MINHYFGFHAQKDNGVYCFAGKQLTMTEVLLQSGYLFLKGAALIRFLTKIGLLAQTSSTVLCEQRCFLKIIR
jgi:hypothetical protein